VNNSSGFFIIILAIAGIIFFSSAYVIDEREQIIITQFGKKIGEPKKDPGIHFKLPIVQKVNRFPKTLLEWDGEKGELPTSNKTYIWVDTFARWRIADPYMFFKTCINEKFALDRIGDIIDPAVKNAVASYKLIESVRNTNRKMDMLEDDQLEGGSKVVDYRIEAGREKIMLEVLEAAKTKLAGFGIELIDVKVKRLNYREDVRESVYDRMIAERTQIVEKLRSQGRGEAQKISGDKERELKRITSEAYKTAQKLKGEADATSVRIFADAFSKDPDFYSFVKTLEVYKEVFDSKSSLVLSTDSDFLKYLKKIE